MQLYSLGHMLNILERSNIWSYGFCKPISMKFCMGHQETIICLLCKRNLAMRLELLFNFDFWRNGRGLYACPWGPGHQNLTKSWPIRWGFWIPSPLPPQIFIVNLQPRMNNIVPRSIEKINFVFQGKDLNFSYKTIALSYNTFLSK